MQIYRKNPCVINFNDIQSVFYQNEDIEEWLKKDTVNICCDKVLNFNLNESEYILIYGVIERKSTDGLKKIYSEYKGIIVENGIKQFLSKKEIENKYVLPTTYHSIYFGELTWSKKILNYCSDTLNEVENLCRNRTLISVTDNNGREFFSWLECLHNKYDFETKNIDNKTCNHGLVPSQYFMKKMKLKIVPNTWEIIDETGNVGGAYFRNKDDGEIKNSELLYIRKDLLEKYLREENGEFFWTIFNERNIDYRQYDNYKDLLIRLSNNLSTFEVKDYSI